MQFVKKTRSSRFVETIKLTIKLGLIILIVFLGVYLLNKIDFPKPNKDIEKIIPNENLKIVK